MFPLFAIALFFILGIAFFAIGKDDFGIKKIKEASNDASSKDNVITNPETASKIKSTEGKDEISEESLKDNEVTENTSD